VALPHRIVVATQNRDKAREMFAILSGLGITLRGLWEWPDAPDVHESGDTLEANAILKARSAAAHTGWWAVADDTGLEVDALGGAPGVYSARYAGANATYADNCAKLLAALSAVPSADRTARFRTVIALAAPDGSAETVEGVVEGRILEHKRGQNGFGYDPVFFWSPKGKTFAEMSAEEKNAVSHRAKALHALRARLAAM
jgi:XTP/dITP diphosphohydrolase